MTFVVQNESLPERCEVCHQTDEFDPETGVCRRCGKLSLSLDGDGRSESIRRLRTFLGRTMIFRKDPIPNGFLSFEEARRNPQPIRESNSRPPLWALLIAGVIFVTVGCAIAQPHFQKRNANQAVRLLGAYQQSLKTLSNPNSQPDYRTRRQNPPNQLTNQPTLSRGFAKAFSEIDHELVRVTATRPDAPDHILSSGWLVIPRKTWWAERAGTDCFYLDEAGVIRHSGSPKIFPDMHSPPLE